jgi:serine/threonine-protein kinase RsbW
MSERLELRIRNDLDEVGPVVEHAAAAMARADVVPSTSYRVQLILEEVLSNVIRHAFADAGEHVIEIKLAVERESIELVVRDDGIPFDPLSAPPVATNLSLEKSRIGGLGIHLVRVAARRIEYRRVGGCNELLLLV